MAPPTPRSPGHKRRPPSLPASAFTPPNTGTSERFPLPPSPSTVHPSAIIDAHVKGNVSVWSQQTAEIFGEKAVGLVLEISEEGVEQALATLPDGSQCIACLIPFDISSSTLPAIPVISVPVGLSTVYTAPAPPHADDILKAALSKDGVRSLEIDVQANLLEYDGGFEAFEDMLTRATTDLDTQTRIVLSNVLPPPDDLDLPIVTLMNHPTYRAFQGRVASLSLFANLHVKFRPPIWGAPTPKAGDRDNNEWKQRIKMYVGPVLEAFGFERIIFGSAPPTGSSVPSNAGDWYELVRESFAELGFDQDAIDGIFAENARKLYVL